MKHTAVVLAVALLLLSAALISYRVIWLGYPVLPTAPGKAWQVSMDAHVKADKKEATVMIGLPAQLRGENGRGRTDQFRNPQLQSSPAGAEPDRRLVGNSRRGRGGDSLQRNPSLSAETGCQHRSPLILSPIRRG